MNAARTGSCDAPVAGSSGGALAACAVGADRPRGEGAAGTSCDGGVAATARRRSLFDCIVNDADFFLGHPPPADDAREILARHDDLAREVPRPGADEIGAAQREAFRRGLIFVDGAAEPAFADGALPRVVADDFMHGGTAREDGGERGFGAEAVDVHDVVPQRRAPDREHRARDAQRPEHAARDAMHAEAERRVIVIERIAETHDFGGVPARGERPRHAWHVAGRAATVGRENSRDEKDLHLRAIQPLAVFAPYTSSRP